MGYPNTSKISSKMLRCVSQLFSRCLDILMKHFVSCLINYMDTILKPSCCQSGELIFRVGSRTSAAKLKNIRLKTKVGV